MIFCIDPAGIWVATRDGRMRLIRNRSPDPGLLLSREDPVCRLLLQSWEHYSKKLPGWQAKLTGVKWFNVARF